MRLIEEVLNNDKNSDPVNHPKHYKSSNGIECIDAIEAAVEGKDGAIAYYLGNAIKYGWRLGKKQNTLEDARKMQWFVNHLVELLEKEGKK